MRTGVFGGTFNPIHCGHVLLARTYAAALHLDRVLVIPTYLPPHKAGGQLAGGCHRLNMCRLAFEGDPVCRVSDIELRRGGKSYTVDTLKQLTRENPSDTFYLIMGSDMFLSLTQWYDWQRIILDAVICAGARSPGQMQALRAEAARLERHGAQIELVALEPLPFSSTQVRARVQAGESLAGFVPPKVADYIMENRLYQSSKGLF